MTSDVPLEQTDRQKDADKLFTSAHRLRVAALSVVVIVIAAGVFVLAVIGFQQHQQITTLQHLVAKQAKQLDASCSFYQDVGSAPLPLTVPKGHSPPSDLGVRIVVHSRAAFAGQNCPGALPPVGPALEKWARFYHLPVFIPPR